MFIVAIVATGYGGVVAGACVFISITRRESPSAARDAATPLATCLGTDRERVETVDESIGCPGGCTCRGLSYLETTAPAFVVEMIDLADGLA